MPASPQRIAANQANSQKSSGPKTQAGKAASSRNSLKHGLTGAGLALPDEDKAELDAAFQRHFDEMKPTTQAGLALVFKIALCTLRLDRFAVAENAVLSQRVIDAGFAFDDAQVARRNEAKAKLQEDPETQLNILSRFQSGVHWVIEAWGALACALETGKLKNWRQPQFALFEALSGRSMEFPSYYDSTFYALAAMGDEGALENPDLEGKSPAERCQSARDKLIAICEAELLRWDAMLESASAATAVARANAIQASRYDGSKEGLLMKKYEAATTRELTKARKEFAEVEATYGEPTAVVATIDPVKPCVTLGSFLAGPEAAPEASEAESIQVAQNADFDGFVSFPESEVEAMLRL